MRKGSMSPVVLFESRVGASTCSWTEVSLIVSPLSYKPFSRHIFLHLGGSLNQPVRHSGLKAVPRVRNGWIRR